MDSFHDPFSIGWSAGVSVSSAIRVYGIMDLDENSGIDFRKPLQMAADIVLPFKRL